MELRFGRCWLEGFGGGGVVYEGYGVGGGRGQDAV